MNRCLRFGLLGMLAVFPGVAAAQSRVDREMARLATASPVDRSARREVARAVATLHDPSARRLTLSALFDPNDCIRSRAGLDVVGQDRIIKTLQQRGWIDPALALAAVREGLFPRLLDDGGACPHLGVPALAGPGGNTGSHHSWPGGLAVHIAINLRSAAALMEGYSTIERAQANRDRTNGAILWHDWAKAMVLRWRPDGTTTEELAVAGTGAHHVLGLAEAMRRGLPPAQIIAQACAHGPATGETLPRVQGWLDAAAIVARVDGSGYRATSTAACFVTHLADQNWIYSDEAVVGAEAWITSQAASLGPRAVSDPTRLRLCVLVPMLAWLGAERIFAALDDPERLTITARKALTDAGPHGPCAAGK